MQTFSVPNFECLTALLSGDKVGPTVARIAQDSRWMEVTPSPNDLFEVTVKNEAGARELFPVGVPLAVHQRSAAAEFCGEAWYDAEIAPRAGSAGQAVP